MSALPPVTFTPHGPQLNPGATEEDVGSDLVFSLMIIVGTGTFFYHHLKVFNIPYTVIMFLYGALLGALALGLPHTFDTYFGLLSSVDPELLFHIFLPILIFEGSYGMKVHAFREVVWQTIILAGPGVAINTILMAIPFKYLLYPEWNWFLVLLVSSLLSATDPVAVVALLKDLGVDKRITALVDGESIMNDGTAIICFTLFLPAARDGIFHMSAADTALKSCQLLLLGIVFGLFCGWLQARLLHFCQNEPVVETFITIAFAFISFFIADQFLLTSGVLALCVQGVYLSSRYPSMFPGKHGSMFNIVWHFLVHFANTIIFSIVGIIIVKEGLSEFEPNDLWKLLVLYISMILARAIMIMMLLPILNRFSYKLTLKECGLLVHSGLRGAVAMTLALIVAKDSGVDAIAGDRVLFHTGGIVILTTVVNATTSKYVVARLGHKRKDLNRILQMRRAHQFVLQEGNKAVRRVTTDRLYTMGNHRMFAKLLSSIEDPYAGLPAKQESDEKVINRLVMRAFKTNVWTQRDANAITEKVVRVLARKATDNIRFGTLIETQQLMDVQQLPWHLKLAVHGPAKFAHYLIVGREQMFFGMLLAYDTAMNDLESALPIYVSDSPKHMRRLHHWLQEERQSITRLIDDFAENKPESTTSVVTTKGAEYILRCMSHAVEDLNDYKGLSIPEADALHSQIVEQRIEIGKWDQEVPQPSTEELLVGCPLCFGISQDSVLQLLQQGTLQDYAEGEKILFGADKFGIVLRGVVSFLGREGWHLGSGSTVNTEAHFGFTRVYLTPLHATSAVRMLLVSFKIARELAANDNVLDENLQFQSASAIARHLLAEHYKYSDKNPDELLDFCHHFGRCLVASNDTYQPTSSLGEVVCLIKGQDSDRILTSESTPMILPRSLKVTWSRGSLFFVVGGNAEKAIAARRHRAVSLTKNASAASPPSPPAFGAPDTERFSELAMELTDVVETAPQHRIGMHAAAYIPDRFATQIPLVNHYHLRFSVMAEMLSDTSEDYAEFQDASTRSTLLRTTDMVLLQLTRWCLDFYHLQSTLSQQHLKKPLDADHAQAHADFLEKIRLWNHQRVRGEMTHTSMLDAMSSFVTKHFVEDKEACAQLVKANRELRMLDRNEENTPGHHGTNTLLRRESSIRRADSSSNNGETRPQRQPTKLPSPSPEGPSRKPSSQPATPKAPAPPAQEEQTRPAETADGDLDLNVGEDEDSNPALSRLDKDAGGDHGIN